MPPDAKQCWDDVYKTRKMVAPLVFTEKVVRYLKDQPGASILDLGCGDGRDALYFSQNGFSVTAIDFSKEAIARLKKADDSITAQVMDILHMDFPEHSFDAVFAHLSLHYFDDPTTRAVFHAVHRMLKSGGYFFIACKSTNDPLYGTGEKVGEHMFKRRYLRHFFDENYMRSMLHDFRILELQEVSAQYDNKKSCFIEAVAQK